MEEKQNVLYDSQKNVLTSFSLKVNGGGEFNLPVSPERIEIIFKNGVFQECRFNFNKKMYNRNDWRILKAIAEEIEMIESEFNKSKNV